MSESWKFDLQPRQIKVEIGDKSYVLKEASEDAAAKYQNALFRSTTLGPDMKPVKVDGLADIEPLLVSLCLYDGEENLVPLDVIRSWPARIVKKLYQWVRENSDLEGGEGDEGEDREEERLGKS